MREISYRCFTAFGGLSNRRLSTRSLATPDGRYLGTVYYDNGQGQLSHPGPSMKGPSKELTS